MYRNSTQNIWKVSSFVSKHSKELSLTLYTKTSKNSYLYTKTLKTICLGSKTFEKYLISTQNIWKVLNFASKHSISIESLPNLCEKYRICTENLPFYILNFIHYLFVRETLQKSHLRFWNPVVIICENFYNIENEKIFTILKMKKILHDTATLQDIHWRKIENRDNFLQKNSFISYTYSLKK